MKRLLTVAVTAGVAILAIGAGSASAAPILDFAELNLDPATINRGDELLTYRAVARNTGPDPTTASPPVTVSFSLPAGVTFLGNNDNSWNCNLETQSCARSVAIPANGGKAPELALRVAIDPDLAPDEVTSSFTVAGGGAAGDVTESRSVNLGPKPLFEIRDLIADACDQAPPAEPTTPACQLGEAGDPYTTAGGHPYQATSSFQIPSRTTAEGLVIPVESMRNLFFDLPAGFIANPRAAPVVCSTEQVVGNICPDAAAVGGINVLSITVPLYRVEPGAGSPAAFAFIAQPPTTITYLLRGKLRASGDYGITAVSPLPPQNPGFLRLEPATLCSFGVKTEEVSGFKKFKGCKDPGTPGSFEVPFLTNPTRCTGPAPVTKAHADSFEHPGAKNSEGLPDLSDADWKSAEATSLNATGCNQVEFDPDMEGRPTTDVADAPTGFDFSLHISQKGLLEQGGIAPAHLRDSTVTLPEGMVVNPSAATGLGACSSSQIGLTTAIGTSPIHFTGISPQCPDAAKIGTVRVETPLLDKALPGAVYLAKQLDNPFGSLLALYIVIDDPESGTIVKLAGKVTPDPVTGRLVVTVEENPQLPFERLDLSTFEGPRASLRTPATCGPKATHAELTPWSAPESGPPAQLTDSFDIVTAPGDGPCATDPSQLPNAPRFSAGTVSPQAGAYSPFVLRLSREDGSQELKGIDAVLPPGLTGRLAGTATCSDAQLARASTRSKPGEGVLERDDPSCPAASEVGSAEVSAGAGPAPYRTSGRAYLTGPYKGAPISISIVTPAVAGPFDLGTVVVRNALYVDPRTAQVTVKSDPIPTILEGIPLDLRSVEVRVTRDHFTLNPTSCEPMSLSATAFGLSSPAMLSSRFQVGGCESLGFKPSLRIQLHGPTRRAAYQRLEATVTAKPGEANIARTAVTLPHSAFLAQEHIRTVCTRVQFATDSCPPGSVYGSAEATTPLLDEQLKGPVYLRSSDNPLPDLVAALRGPDDRPIEVELAGRTDSIHGGIRNTFDIVPDAPVSKFKLKLFGGKKSLIINSRNLCKGKTQRATVRMTAHNGKVRNFRLPVRNDCHKGKKRKGAGKKSNAPKRTVLSLKAW